jgi:hypothetical protein
MARAKVRRVATLPVATTPRTGAPVPSGAWLSRDILTVATPGAHHCDHVLDHGSDAVQGGLGFWKAASKQTQTGSKIGLKCLQGGRAHPIAACEVATLCCSPPAP